MRLLAPLLLLLAAAGPASAGAAERLPFDSPPLIDDAGNDPASAAGERPAQPVVRSRLPDAVLARVASGDAIAAGLRRRVIVLPPQAIGPFDRVAGVEQRVGIAEVRGEAASLPLTGLTFMPNGGLDITISQVGAPSR